jgi:hypothetical protein
MISGGFHYAHETENMCGDRSDLLRGRDDDRRLQGHNIAGRKHTNRSDPTARQHDDVQRRRADDVAGDAAAI